MFLHNTKVSTSKINEDKAREDKRENSHVQGRVISHMEMLHVMIKYPEIINDLDFINIPKLPLEFRAGIDCDKKHTTTSTSTSNPTDEANAG